MSHTLIVAEDGARPVIEDRGRAFTRRNDIAIALKRQHEIDALAQRRGAVQPWRETRLDVVCV